MLLSFGPIPSLFGPLGLVATSRMGRDQWFQPYTGTPDRLNII